MTPLEIASFVAAILLAASRLLPASEALWRFLPASVRWLPPVLLVALPQAAGYFGMVQTRLDLAEAFLLTIALVVPGARSATHKKLAKSAAAAVLMLFLLPSVTACSAASKAIAKTAVETAAELLCSDFFAQKRGISVDQARELFCSHKDVLDPFLEQALAAQRAAGAAALSSTPDAAGQ